MTKTIVLVVAMAQLVGCMVIEDAGGGGDGGDYHLTSTFDVKSGFSNFVKQPGDEVRVNARLAGSNTTISEAFSPDDSEVALAGLTGGTYDYWVDYVSFRGIVVDSTPKQSIVVDGDVTLDTVLTLNKGFWQFNIELEDANGSPKTCADFPSEMSVRLDYSVRDTIPGVAPGGAAIDSWTCEETRVQGLVYTSPIPLAYYEIQMKLVDGSGRVLAQSDRYSANILGGNDYINLGYFNSPTVVMTSL